MSLWILANTVNRDAVELRLTTDGYVKQSAASHVGSGAMKGGPRSLKWTISSSARIAWYVNNTASFTATHCVWVDAIAHDGRLINLMTSDPTYSTIDGMGSEVMAAPYVGIGGSDKVFEVDFSTPVALMGVDMPSGYSKTLRQVYFCDGLEIQHTEGPLKVQRVPVYAPAEYYEEAYYKLHAKAQMTLGPLTRAEVDAYYGLPKRDPIFLYDSSGDYLPEKLWHCVVFSEVVDVQYQDGDSELLFLSLDIGILKHGSG